MKKKMNTWVTVVLTAAGVMLVLGGICLAGFHKMHASKRKILKEANSFMATTVIPELKPLREELDRAFSEEEKQKVDELRTDAKALAGMYTELHEKYHQGDDPAEVSMSDADVEAVRQSQKTMRRIISECWLILDNNEEEFEALTRDMMPLISGWHEEMKDRMGKYMPRHKSKGHGKMLRMHKAHARFGDALVSPVLFILFEPETGFPIVDFQASMEKYLSQKRHHKKRSRK